MEPPTSRKNFHLQSLNLCLSTNAYARVLEKKLNANGVSIAEVKTSKDPPLLIMTDGQIPNMELKTLISQFKVSGQKIIIANCSQRQTPLVHTLQFLELGANDVLQANPPEYAISSILGRLKRWKFVKHILNSDKIKKAVIGKCQAFQGVLSQMIESVCFSKRPILLLGESGTGKEVFGKLIHKLDRKYSKGELVVVDCTTIVSDLAGSELFGHEKGAFTHAIQTREGAIGLSDGGCLFLDEIGDLPLPLQAEFLRVIQERTFKKVGSNQWKGSDFRLICATNRNLKEAVDHGHFRLDLYYRIAACVLTLPALRERKEDVPLLAKYFLSQALQREEIPPFDLQMMDYLKASSYPGNIRELKQLIFQIASHYCGEGPITIGCLPQNTFKEIVHTDKTNTEDWQKHILMAIAEGHDLKGIKRMAGNTAMDIAINQAAGNLPEAAKLLNVSDRTLQTYQASKKKEISS